MTIRSAPNIILLGLMLFTSGPLMADTYLLVAQNESFPARLVRAVERAGGTLYYPMEKVGLALFDSNDPEFTRKAAGIRGIRFVTPDLQQLFAAPVIAESVSAESVEPPFTGDDDFWFDLQWGHDAIDAQAAWARGYRGAGVRVAVLDSGIDADHGDLASNLNLALSRSFVAGEGFDIDPGFYFNHGTHVAGIIAAADNAYGMIGVAPEAELVAVKVLSEYSGSGSFGGIFAGMYYAAIIDADVMNLSLGANVPRSCGQGPGNSASDCEALITAGIRVARFATREGTLIIASAGNESRDFNADRDTIELPNDLPGVVTIAATAPVGWLPNFPTSLDNPASYSNFGTSRVSFAAPGGDFVYPGNEFCGFLVPFPCWVYDMVWSTISEGWTYTAGTSMAAPHATGVAALIIGANGGSMSPARVIAAMVSGAEDLGQPGKDDHYGLGRLNADRSIP